MYEQEVILEDCVLYWCLPCCTLAQEARHVDRHMNDSPLPLDPAPSRSQYLERPESRLNTGNDVSESNFRLRDTAAPAVVVKGQQVKATEKIPVVPDDGIQIEGVVREVQPDPEQKQRQSENFPPVSEIVVEPGAAARDEFHEIIHRNEGTHVRAEGEVMKSEDDILL